jgi:hypothetical protein
MKARSAHIVRDTRSGRLCLLVVLAPQMEMLDFAQLAPCLAMRAMMYATSPLCYLLLIFFASTSWFHIDYCGHEQMLNISVLGCLFLREI